MRPSLPEALAGATVAGTATLLFPSTRWWPWLRRTWVVLPGVAAVCASAIVLAAPAPDDRPDRAPGEAPDEVLDRPEAERPAAERLLRRARRAPFAARLGLSLAVGGLVCAGQAQTLWTEAAVERWLRRRGLAHPHRWAAAAAALVVLAGELRGGHEGTGSPRR